MEWITTSIMLRDLRDFEKEGAWAGFVERFRRPIIAFARKLGHSSEDAEDIAQESLLAFAEAYRAGRYDQDKGRLSQWLFGFAYHQALKARDRNARRQEAAGGGDPRSFFGDLPDQNAATNVWDREWRSALLEECLDIVRSEVEPVTFRAFELTAIQHQTAEAAAEQLGIATTTVYNAKHRVVKRLREMRDLFEEA